MALAQTSTDPVSIADALRPALLRVSRRVRKEAQKVGASVLDVMLLSEVKRRPGIGVCDLAEAEQMARPTMSTHIKRLEAAGLIARALDAEDGRRSGLSITAAGLKQLDAVRRQRNDWLAARLAKLSDDDRAKLAAAAPVLLAMGSLEA